ncbi:MAG: GNAT family N-acetyltransferase, partial [Gemmatimonadaceae bacterium]|nr:GNAT family N-acetyltransferase [Gemmatimonadaceae bacterium]
MDPVTFRDARPDDAAALSIFARDTFLDAFRAQNEPEDVALYIATAYTPARQGAEIADPASTIRVAESRDAAGRSTLVGYAHLIAGDVPVAVTGPAPIELRRFYIAPAAKGTGLATRLMADAIARARRRGAATLWLGVWERNARGIRFYQREGFTHVG